ncbi:MAG: DUF362 domain-containing protein [Kiritimatiellae bacterium]|nr:DUF362 domain-containing protein [Kiritimatiellia bacterium]
MYLKTMNRRAFLKQASATGAAMTLAPSWLALAAEQPAAGPDVWVIHGEDKGRLMAKALEIIFANGGLGSKPDTLTLKVNAAWSRLPEEGACTHPELVRAFLAGCRSAGVKKTIIPEHPCNAAAQAFTRSGIQAAADKFDVPMLDLKKEKKLWKTYDIPEGRSLKKAEVARPFMETDVLVNMPVAKHHGGATLTMAMKNWMGAVSDRGWWHRNDLHQCIADCATLIKPRWTIIDATRIMLSGGPQGPSKDMKHPNLLVVSRDQVAADCFTATLFHDSIAPIRYLTLAREMKIGETDLTKMNLHRVEA